MREIKFRGKRIDNGEWVYGSLVIWGPIRDRKYSIMPIPNDVGVVLSNYGVDPATVGQYTGLKDKNGKEIYEGDIAKPPHGQSIEQITFSRGCFQTADIKTPNRNLYLLDTYSEYLEVIGNIHDNPELLEVQP